MLKIKSQVHQYKDVRVKLPSLSFETGITIVQGKNGCGKSTLFKSLCGLLTHPPKIKDYIYLPEQPSMPPKITVKKYLDALNALSNTSLNRVEYLIALFGLEDKSNKELSKLSKGMHQKVALIGVLNENRTYYLLDEPFNGLDQKSLNKVCAYIKNMKGYIIIATHEKIPFLSDYKVIKL